MNSPAVAKLSRTFERASGALAVVAGFCLIVLMLMIVGGVVMRYGFGKPILGMNELIKMTSVATIMAALPYATFHRAHVRVDVFDPMIGRWGRLCGDVVSRLLSIFVLSVLSYRAALRALEAIEFGDVTNMLGLPQWPFYAILSCGAVLCATIFAVQILERVLDGADQEGAV